MGDTHLWEKGSVKMESVEEVKRKSKEKESRFGKRYGFELKLRCVKLRVEEGLPVSLLSKEEEQGGRESVWEEIWIRVQTSVCEA